MNTPEQDRQEHLDKKSRLNNEHWFVGLYKGIEYVFLMILAYIVVGVPLRVIEVIISLSLLFTGISVAVAVIVLFQTSGSSLLSWSVVVFGLPLAILLFKIQFDSEKTTHGIISRLEIVLNDVQAKRKFRK